MATFEDLQSVIQREHLKVDLDLLRLAYETAQRAHAGQVRLSGDPVITHPLATAIRLAALHLDEETIIAGLLHDLPEDTDVTIEQIRKDFGDNVATLVDGVTKLGTLKYRGMDRYVENLRRMFIAMAKDIRVILIKFADRLHNLETLQHHPKPAKRLRIAQESLEIYAPIANRLGMGDMKGQLEDFAFPYVYPKECEQVNRLLRERLGDGTQLIDEVIAALRRELAQRGIRIVDVHGRAKHAYSLFKKLRQPGINGDISKVYDIIAVRIILKNVEDCYATLGVVHGLWRPLPGRIKDYVAQPKPNGYRSIHTTVFSPQGKIVEIQIRDVAMHEAAEYGIAAHWHYDEGGKPFAQTPVSERLGWVRELSEWKREVEDEYQYLESLKIDVFRNRIFCFTPNGDVIDLPEGATAIDFAYAVHTDLGNRMTGVRVNGSYDAVTTELKSGDVVEVVIDRNRSGPNPDWLPVVKTHLARERIRRAQKESRETESSAN